VTLSITMTHEDDPLRRSRRATTDDRDVSTDEPDELGETTEPRMTNTDEATTDRRLTRRAALAGLGATFALPLAGCLGGDSTVSHGWNAVDSNTQKALYDVVMTTDGPLAVGEGGQVLARRETDWEPVVENGPAGGSNGLVAAAVTADRRAAWFCGSSGAIGRYTSGGNVTDYTAPGGKTSSWVDLATLGPAGRERVFLINGSGELLGGRMNAGSITWGAVTKPAGGLSVEAIAYAGSAGYLCDGNGDVYRARGGGAVSSTGGGSGSGGGGGSSNSNGNWQRVGIDGVGGTLRDAAAFDSDAVDVVSENGVIHVYNGFNWLSIDASEKALHAISRAGERGLAAGVGGTIVSLTEGNWRVQETPTDVTLHGVTVAGADYSAVAVGANGTILERFA